MATVTTLAETRSNDMEFASALEKLTRMGGVWRLAENHGLGPKFSTYDLFELIIFV